MRTLRPQRFPVATFAATCALAVGIGMMAMPGRSVLGQTPAAPAAPREVAEFFVRLLTAKRVDVRSLLAANAAELPFFRVRLYVGPVVPSSAWRGVDYQPFRESRGVRTDVIELAAPQGSFRAIVNDALDDPRAVTTEPGEAGLRVVDVWCRHSGAAGGHVPLLVKVIDAKDRQTGRICRADQPQLSECMLLLDPGTVLEEDDGGPLSAASDAVETLATCLEVRRAEIATLQAAPPANSVSASHVPGGVSVELLGLRDIPVSMLEHDHTICRTLPEGESFIGLASDSATGTATISFELPFSAGGAAVRAPARISDETAVIDVEVSADGGPWTRLYRLDATTMKDDALHTLPESIRGAKMLRVRARLTARESMAAPVRDVGLRFLPVDPPVAAGARLRLEQGTLRVLRREASPLVERVAMRLVLQPALLEARDFSAMVREHPPELDVFAPCELDEEACRDIGAYAGVTRFWCPPDWPSIASDRVRAMVAGPGLLVFPRLQTIPAEWAATLAGGKKSLGFPGLRDPGRDVLAALATSAAELALDGIEILSPEQGAAIGEYRGQHLSLAGLRRVDLTKLPADNVLRAMVASSGTCTLSGITELDEATAAVLAAGRKHLQLDAITTLSPPIAAILARSRKALSLDGLATLDPDCAGALLAFSGESLSLAGLRSAACRIDDLPTFFASKRATLQGLLLPPRTTEQDAAASRGDWREELEALVGQLMKLNLCDDLQKEQWLARASEGDDALKEVIESIRKDHPKLPLPSKVRIDPPRTTPLDACVRSPGVFVLHPSAGAAAGKIRFGREMAMSLARGRKHLNLDCLTDRELTPEVAAALASASTIVSLDGITVLEKDCVEAFTKYGGPLVSLANVGEVDATIAEQIMPLFKEHRVSLPQAGLVDVADLRGFVNARRESDTPETAAQKKTFGAFLDRSKRQEWTPVGRAPKFRAQVVQLFPGEVEFELVGGQRVRGPRARLMPANQATLDRLQECAKEVAAVRKDDLYGESLRGEVSSAP